MKDRPAGSTRFESPVFRSDTPLDGALLENAVASVVSSVVSREQTISMCGLQSIMSALRSAPWQLRPSTVPWKFLATHNSIVSQGIMRSRTAIRSSHESTVYSRIKSQNLQSDLNHSQRFSSSVIADVSTFRLQQSAGALGPVTTSACWHQCKPSQRRTWSASSSHTL